MRHSTCITTLIYLLLALLQIIPFMPLHCYASESIKVVTTTRSTTKQSKAASCSIKSSQCDDDCSCNVKFGVCDLNCCCDTDCSSEEIRYFELCNNNNGFNSGHQRRRRSNEMVTRRCSSSSSNSNEGSSSSSRSKIYSHSSHSPDFSFKRLSDFVEVSSN